jgi:hypothetical protein
MPTRMQSLAGDVVKKSPNLAKAGNQIPQSPYQAIVTDTINYLGARVLAGNCRTNFILSFKCFSRSQSVVANRFASKSAMK